MSSTTSTADATQGSADSEEPRRPVKQVGFVKETALVDSDLFSASMGVLVLANVLTIGLETDLTGSAPELFALINDIFLLVYLAELCMRLLTHGGMALRDHLTVADVLLVLLAFVERMTSGSGVARALPAFRLFRLARLSRVMRLLRFSKHLQVLRMGGASAAVTVVWVAMLLFLLLWSGAIFMQRVIGMSDVWLGTLDPRVEHEPFSSFDNRQYFGSVSQSFLSLFQVMTLSQGAGRIARPVIMAYPLTFLFFLFFLFATAYGLLFGIIANIAQESIVAARSMDKALLEVKREDRELIGIQVMELLRMADQNDDLLVTVKELRQALETTDLKELLKRLDVPVLDADNLIRLFDRNGDGTLTYEELVHGIVSMAEDIKSRDYIMLAMWLNNLRCRAKLLEQHLDRLSTKIIVLQDKLKGANAAVVHFMQTKDSSDLRRRALRSIRRALPEEAPVLVTRGQQEPSEAEPVFDENVAAAFLSFVRRFMQSTKTSRGSSEASEVRASSGVAAVGIAPGEDGQLTLGPEHPGSPTEEGLRVAAAVRGRGLLPPAPPRLEIAKAIARKEEAPVIDKYAVQPYSDQPGFRPSPNLLALRELLH